MYMTLGKVAAMLDSSLGIARKWCEENKIRAFSLGVGRGRGMRYLAVDIDNALNKQVITLGKEEKKKNIVPRFRPLANKSLKEQVNLICGDKHVVQ